MPLPKEAFGNPTGWILATLLVAGIGAGLVSLHRHGAPTTMTAFGADAANYGTIALPIDPGVVVPGWPHEAGDATEQYRLAADAYTTSLLARRPYEDFLRESVRAPAGPGALPLLQHLLTGARRERATLLGGDPSALVNYDQHLPRLDALYALGQVAMKQAGLLAARNSAGDLAEARRLYEAAFILGVHLFDERIVHREMEYGYRVISQSLGGLIALAKKEGHDDRAAILAERRTRFGDYVNGRLQPVWDKISAINVVRRDDDTADVHIGDIFAIAQSEAADPLWRLEAILRLGKARHDASREADRAAAERHLRHLDATLTDPRLQLAIEQAMALTQAQRMHAR